MRDALSMCVCAEIYGCKIISKQNTSFFFGVRLAFVLPRSHYLCQNQAPIYCLFEIKLFASFACVCGKFIKSLVCVCVFCAFFSPFFHECVIACVRSFCHRLSVVLIVNCPFARSVLFSRDKHATGPENEILQMYELHT